MSNAAATKATDQFTRYGANAAHFRARHLRDLRSHAESWSSQYRSELAWARKYAGSVDPVTAAWAVECGVRALTVTGPYAMRLWREYRAARKAVRS